MIPAPTLSSRHPLPPETLRTIRVLIVEDQEEDYFYIERMLRKATFARYEAVWCPTYEQALDALAERRHDVALFDYNLGAGTGLDLLRDCIRMGCDQPVILLTGHDSVEVDRAALGAGAADYLCKNDLNIVQLERSIRYSLRHAAMLSSVQASRRQLELFMKNVPCAVCIRDEEGRHVFQNERFSRHFENAPSDSVWASANTQEPRSFTDGENYWLVNSFPMGDEIRGALQGLAAVDITERVKAEEMLLKATHLLNCILKSLPVIVWSVDEEGAILEARGSGLDGMGLDPEQVVGRSLVGLAPNAASEIAKAFKTGSANFILSVAHGGREHAFDTFLHHGKASGRTAVGFSIDITERRWLERKVLLISDAEQQRIGADLHDGLGQHLTGIACLSAALREQLRSRNLPESKQADHIARLVNDATAQTRALARGLCPVRIDQSGLPSALEHLAYQVELLHGIECRFESNVDSFECEHDRALHLYRIAQEAVNNAVRHGGAKHVTIALDSHPEGGSLRIEDDGSGFDPAAGPAGPGVGLRLMEYRAGVIGGEFSIGRREGGGMRAECVFPFEPPA